MDIKIKQKVNGRFYVEIMTHKKAIFKSMSFKRKSSAEVYGDVFKRNFMEFFEPQNYPSIDEIIEEN
jgi:hypothetical protein